MEHDPQGASGFTADARHESGGMMATETVVDVSIWEKIGDGFTTFAEMPLALGPTDKKVMMGAWQSGVKYGMLKKAPASPDEVVWPNAIMQ